MLEKKYDNWKNHFKRWLLKFPEIEFDDIFNPVLTKLWVKSISTNVEALPEYRKEDGIYSYIFVCLKRTLLNVERNHRGGVHDPYDYIIESLENVSTTLRDIEDYELGNLLKEAFKGHDTFCTNILLRFYVEGYEYSEMKTCFIAEYSEVRIENLRYHKMTCLKKLRDFMGIKLKQKKKN